LVFALLLHETGVGRSAFPLARQYLFSVGKVALSLVLLDFLGVLPGVLAISFPYAFGILGTP
jgi:hypothetical protein